MGLQRPALLLAAVFLLPFTPIPAAAQYIYLDTNGNGIHDAGDRLATGTTSAGVWLDSSRNRDGSPASCLDTQYYSFSFILHATGGTISNPGLTSSPGTIVASSSTDICVESVVTGHSPGGLYVLGTVSLDATPGSSLGIATSTPLASDYCTSIGSNCAGSRFDNTLRLGEDWFDADGLPPASNSAPSLMVTGPTTVPHGVPVCLGIDATDSDAADLLTISYVGGGPASLNNFIHTPSVSPASAQLCGTPTCAEVGTTYVLDFSVSDGVNPAVHQTHSFTVTNATPVVGAPPTRTVQALASLTFTVTVTDPDDASVPLTWSGSAFAAGATMTPAGAGAWNFAWVPCTAGPYTATFSAQDPCGATGTAQTAITVTNGARYVGGTVFFDDNGNAVGLCGPEAGEPGLPGWTVQMRNSSNQLVSVAVTNSAGMYQCWTSLPGTYTLRAIPPTGTGSYWAQSCPGGTGAQSVDLSCTKLLTGINFAQNNTGSTRDLVSTVSLAGPPKPGFDRYYYVTYQNRGNAIFAGATLRLDLPVVTPPITLLLFDPRFSPVATSSPPSVTWSLPPLAPGASGWVYALMRIHPATPVGTKLTAISTINPIPGDARPGDNTYKSMVKVVSALDPNAKGVLPEGRILRADTLRYHVDFQNVGTAPADSVAIVDVLDDALDADSLEIIGASHEVTVEIQDRQMTWTFAGINLADSTSDEPASHGFVEYTLRPRADAPDGTGIDNLASIYFDFNPAVITNSVHSIIDSPPVLAPVPDRSVVEGSTAQQPLSGSDPEADSLTFSLVSGPTWASVVNTGSATGRLDLAPQSGDAGTVTLTVEASDGILADQQSLTVSVFTPTGVGLSQRLEEQKVRLTSNEPQICLRLEPVSGSFRAADVDPSSVVIRSAGTGTVAQVAAVDRTGEGSRLEEVCFASDAMRALLAGVGGTATVTAECEGQLRTGERFSATLPLRVSAAAGRLAASITPHPVNGASVLRFRTLGSGFARVSLHDVNGRLVRTLFDTPTLAAGYHEVPLGGAKGKGGHLVSGIYFYRIETAEGVQSGRAIVLR